jgi:hypothetical protein
MNIVGRIGPIMDQVGTMGNYNLRLNAATADIPRQPPTWFADRAIALRVDNLIPAHPKLLFLQSSLGITRLVSRRPSDFIRFPRCSEDDSCA